LGTEGIAIAMWLGATAAALLLGLTAWAAFGRSGAPRAGRAGAPPACVPRAVLGTAGEILAWASLRRHAPKGTEVLARVPLEALVSGVGGARQRAEVHRWASGHQADFVVVEATTARPLHVVQIVRLDAQRRQVPPDPAVAAACARARIPLLRLITGEVDWEVRIREAFSRGPSGRRAAAPRSPAAPAAAAAASSGRASPAVGGRGLSR
jgi:hypothetical protein